MFIDIHIVQSVPFSNLNRDENGSPKTVPYGGATRARVSSQSWKRVTRLRVESLLESAKTYRTRNPHDRLADLLAATGVELTVATGAARWVFKMVGTETTDKKDNVILFVAETELEALRDVYLANQIDIDRLASAPPKAKAKAAKDDEKEKKTPEETRLTKLLHDCLTVPRASSVALFGRMLASAPTVNVDAAVQVAHAFSVHPVDIEIDYFSAAEDIPTPEDLTGGAHIGTAEFLTATFYRHATIDIRELLQNIGGERDVAKELAVLLLSSFALSIPTGKNNVTAPHTVPDLVTFEVRADRPLSYAAAFEEPIRSHNGYAQKAVDRLEDRVPRIHSMVDAPLANGHITSLPTSPSGLGPSHPSLSDLIDSAVTAAFASR